MIWSMSFVFQDWQNIFQQLDLQVWTYKIDNMSLVFQDWQNVFQQLDLPVWTYKIEDWKTVSGVSPKEFAKSSLNSGVWSLQMDRDCLAFHTNLMSHIRIGWRLGLARSKFYNADSMHFLVTITHDDDLTKTDPMQSEDST